MPRYKRHAAETWSPGVTSRTCVGRRLVGWRRMSSTQTMTGLLARVLVRSYHLAPPERHRYLCCTNGLATPGIATIPVSSVRGHPVNAGLRDRGYAVADARRAALHRYCPPTWGIPVLTPTAYDRGFIDLEDLHRRANPLCAYSILKSPAAVSLGLTAVAG